ncbi:MAG: hypothetical protein GXN99_03020, partial [Candidatus Nanohaloarchaeota archaeon]|nr:hypothetical protein [Candidatus Nanohaloarchaeota archaeon]
MSQKSLILLFTVLACFFPSFAYSLNIPLTVTDYADTNRVEEPVLTGMPIAEHENIYSSQQLILTDSQGNPLPAQFTILSRWNATINDSSAPIKWVLIDTQLSLQPNETKVLYLKNTSQPYDFPTNLTIQNLTDQIIVTTGKAKFIISKQYFNLFDQVYVDTDGNGIYETKIIDQNGSNGLVLVDNNSIPYYTTLEPPELIEIEEQNKLRAVIRIRGVFKNKDGKYFAPSLCHTEKYPRFCQIQFYPHSFFYYNARIYFYNNKDYVKVFLTIENNGANGRTNPEQYYAPVQMVYLDSLALYLNHTLSQPIISSYNLSPTTLSSSEIITIYQGWKNNLTDSIKDTLEPLFSKGIYYQINQSNRIIAEGKTHPGYIQMDQNNKHLAFAQRFFWQNFPKKLTANTSHLVLGFWPSEGYYPYCDNASFPDMPAYCLLAGYDANLYLFDAGRHKTYEFFLGFGNTSASYLSKAIKNPLMLLAPPAYYAETKALGMIAPAGLTSQNPEINEAMQRYDRLQTSLVYSEDSDNGWTILNIKTANPPHWEFTRQNRFWGWMNFGDLLWSGQAPSALHYDWTQNLLIHYLRTGKRKLFDAGVEMAKHRYDVDQYHGERTDDDMNHKYTNGFQFYESSSHNNPAISTYSISRISKRSHTWNGGLLLYYLLTGDKLAYEAAEENIKALLNSYAPDGIYRADKPSCVDEYAEIRHEGWSIVNLINFYRVTGDPYYLEIAKNITKNKLLYSEQQQGGKGYWGVSSSNCANQSNILGCGLCAEYQWSTMYVYVLEAIINSHYETNDTEIKDLILRMCNFSQNILIQGGIYDENGNYLPLQTNYKQNVFNPSTGEPVKTLWFADLFSYCYHLTNNESYLNFAKNLFKDGVFYYAQTGSEYINPSVRSKISYIEGMFSNSHTKVHGWIGRTNLLYLYTEWILQQGDLMFLISNTLPNGMIMLPYSYVISVVGGSPPYYFSIIQGSLPYGLTLNQTTGEIEGIPGQEGIFTFTIQVQDSDQNIISKTFTLQIKPNSNTPQILNIQNNSILSETLDPIIYFSNSNNCHLYLNNTYNQTIKNN